MGSREWGVGSRGAERELCSGNATSLAGLLPWALRLLADAGIESAGFEMQLLLAQALNVSRVSVIAATYPPPAPAQLDTFIRLVRQRAKRVPLAYLRGDQEFYGLPFHVTPDVLIPRPETELLVDFAIREYKSWQPPNRSLPSPCRRGAGGEVLPSRRCGEGGWGSASAIGRGGEVFTLADVGTGSGCIATAILAHCPAARAVGFDLSRAALDLAWRNAARNGVAERLRLVQGCLLTAAQQGRFDAIVSNPPYIRSGEIATLQAEVRDYEPRLALDGGTDGLAVYPQLAADARRALKPGGHLFAEVGQGQAHAVAQIFRAAGLEDVRIMPDLAGIDRVVAGTSFRAAPLQLWT